MNKSIAQQVVSTLLIIYFLSFIIFLGYTGFRLFSNNEVLLPLVVVHLFQSSLYLLLTYLIPLTGTGIILAFSLRVKLPAISSTVKKNENFHKMITSILVTVIVLSVIYTLIHLNFTPSLIRELDDHIYITQSATQYRQEGDKALAAKNYQEAIRFYSLYLRFDKDDQAVRNKKINAEYALTNLGTNQPKPKATENKQPLPSLQGYNVRSLLAKAHEYEGKKDYLSAYYFAKQALVLDTKNTEAKVLANSLWEKLAANEPTLTEQKVFGHYADKSHAFSIFQNKQYLEAYYAFGELKGKYPADKELDHFLEESRLALQENIFFYEEIAETIPVPGIRNIAFIQSTAENTKEVIFIGKLVTTNIDYFFHDIEIFSFKSNSYTYQYYPYGKYIKNYINVNCVPSQRPATPLSTDYTKINLQLDARYLPGFSLEKEGLKRLSLSELISLNQLYAQSGYQQTEISMNILLGALNPCLFFIIALLSISLGWVYRTRYLNTPPFFTYLLIPVIPLGLFLFTNFLEYIYKLLIGFFIMSAGFFPAMICLVITTVILLFISLFILACQKI